MSKILISGFEPFAGASENSTRVLINELQSDYETVLLPVEFGRSARALMEKIDSSRPTVVVSLGQAEGRTAITPERIAINCADARIPDNAGVSKRNEKIVKDGADGYFTTLPIAEMVDAMSQLDIPAEISLSAGTFVCNHVFYSMQHQLRNSEVRSGFIHVPLLDQQQSEFPGKPTMNLESMLRGIHAALAAIP